MKLCYYKIQRSRHVADPSSGWLADLLQEGFLVNNVTRTLLLQPTPFPSQARSIKLPRQQDFTRDSAILW